MTLGTVEGFQALLAGDAELMAKAAEAYRADGLAAVIALAAERGFSLSAADAAAVVVVGRATNQPPTASEPRGSG